MGSRNTKRSMIDATKTFIRRGDRITIKAITDACFVNIAALNYHFGSKEVLVEIAIAEILDELGQELFALTRDVVRSDQRQEISYIKDLLKKIFEFAKTNPGALNTIFGIPKMLSKLGETLSRCFGDVGVITFEYDDSNVFMPETRSKIVEKAIQRMIVVVLISPTLIDYTHSNGILSHEFFNDEEAFDTYVKHVFQVLRSLF